MGDIESEVKQILKTLDAKEEQLVPDADLMNDLGADSLDITEMIMFLEEKYGIEIPDEDVPKIRTVQQVIDYVKNHLPAEARK